MRARLTVRSDVWSLAEIEHAVGRPSDAGGHYRGAGDSALQSRRARLWSEWVLNLPTGGDEPMERLDEMISNMSIFLATGISTASRSGCDVRLCITQESPAPLVVALSPSALAWLTRANATLQTSLKPRFT